MLDFQEHLAKTKSFIVEAGDIKIIGKDRLEVAKQPIQMTHTAFKDLLELAGLTQKVVYHLNDTLKRDAGYMIVKQIMQVLSSQTKRKIKLYISEDTREVARISSESVHLGSGAPISPSAIEDLINYAVERTGKKLSVRDTFITDGGTKVTFNLRWDVKIPLMMPNEDIVLGKQITWDLLGDTVMSDFVERLICRNGMTGIVPRNGQVLNSDNTPSDWYDLIFNQLTNPNKETIKEYEANVLRAMQANLSVLEFNTIKGHVIAHWKDDADKILRYIGDERWKTEYKNKAIDLEKLTAGQLRNCPTPVNAWDAVNLLTDLASHQYKTPVSHSVKKETQRMAGKLIRKTWDDDIQMTDVPKFPRSTPDLDL